MVKVFISYAHEDITAAMKLYEKLKCISGVEPWLDKKCLTPGIRWKPAIRKAIRESRFFVALLSEHSIVKKGFFQKELSDALEILNEFPEDQTYLIPVRLEACNPPSERLREIQFVDFFPDWKEGLTKVLKVIKETKEDRESEQNVISTGYEYRCGIIDLDTGLTNIPQIAGRLNDVQHFFLFTCPRVSLNTDIAVRTMNDSTNLDIDKLPNALYEHKQYLNADFVVCLTKYPIAFRNGGYLRYNYFSRPSSIDDKFMFISTHLLYEFTKQAKCTFEKGIAYIMIGQLLVYFTDFGYHKETRECVMDFCENRRDMIKGLKKMRICHECSVKIRNTNVKEAIEAILADSLIV
jgi:hypothetical protein